MFAAIFLKQKMDLQTGKCVFTAAFKVKFQQQTAKMLFVVGIYKNKDISSRERGGSAMNFSKFIG